MTVRRFCAHWKHTAYVTLSVIPCVGRILYIEEWTITFLRFEFEFITIMLVTKNADLCL